MKGIIVAILVLFLTVPVFSQSVLGFESNGLHLDFLLQATNFNFDGSSSSIVGGANPAVGLKYKLKVFHYDIDPGVYGYSNVAIKNGKEPNFELGGIIGVKIWKGFVGLGTAAYKEGQGFVKLFAKENGFLSIAFDLTLF